MILRKISRCLVTAFFVVSTTSCSNLGDSSTRPNFCSQQSDCTEGHCDLQQSLCVVDRSTHFITDAIFTPNSAELSRVRVQDIMLTSSLDEKTNLARQVLVGGVLLDGALDSIPTDQNRQAISARLTFERNGAEPIRIDTYAEPKEIGEFQQPLDWAAPLEEGQTYTVRVELVESGDAARLLAPFTQQIVANQEDPFIALVFPAPTESCTDQMEGMCFLSGTVNRIGRDADSVQATVFVRNENGTVVSGRALTREDGSFRLAVDRSNDKAQLVITLPTENQPRFVFDLDDFSEKTYSIPEFSTIPYRGAVESKDKLEPVTGATVTIDGTDENGSWELQARVTTDDKGEFQTELPNGQFVIQVQPNSDEDSALGTIQEQIRVDNDGSGFLQGQTFQLPSLPHLCGRYVYQGIGVENARIQFQNLEGRTFETTSLMDGEFEVHLPQGMFSYLVLPQEGSGLPIEISDKPFQVSDTSGSCREITIEASTPSVYSTTILYNKLPISGVLDVLIPVPFASEELNIPVSHSVSSDGEVTVLLNR